jgi:ABC-type uncharacterized transport system substrate-binding protein
MIFKLSQPFVKWISVVKSGGYLFLMLLILNLLVACQATPAPKPAQVEQSQAKYAGKKIVWVDSYHQGYEWSDGLEDGLKEVLDKTGVELKVIRMDTQRNPDEAFGKEAGLKAKAEIEAFKPDLVIASDDSAQKYLIEPYYKNTDMPVVFAAVNWDASVYGYPTKNITGMLEVELVEQMMELLKPYAKGERVGYLGPDIVSDQKVVSTYNKRFFNDNMQVRLVKNLEEYKQAYVEMQDKVDILMTGNPGVLKDWDDAKAKEFEQFILKNTRIPSGARAAWVTPYILLSIAKTPVEQGKWAAQTALQILDGTPVSSIPITANKEGILKINLDMAEKLSIVFPPSVLRNAEIYQSKK